MNLKSYLLTVFLIMSCAMAVNAEQISTRSQNISILKEQMQETAKEQEALVEAAFKSEAYVRYIPANTVSAQSGKVGIVDTASKQSYEMKAFGVLPLGFSVESRYTGINNTTVVELPPSLTAVSLGMEITGPFFTLDKTYLFTGFYPSWFGSKWNFRPSSFRIPMSFLVIHQPSEKLALLAGIAVYPDFKDKVVPVFGLAYTPNDKLTFNLMPPDPYITYKLNEKISLFGEGGFESNEYEVDRGSNKNVVLQYESAYAGGGLEFTLNKNVMLSFSTGQVFLHKLQYRDYSGKANIKDGMYVNFRLEIDI